MKFYKMLFVVFLISILFMAALCTGEENPTATNGDDNNHTNSSLDWYSISFKGNITALHNQTSTPIVDASVKISYSGSYGGNEKTERTNSSGNCTPQFSVANSNYQNVKSGLTHPKTVKVEVSHTDFNSISTTRIVSPSFVGTRNADDANPNSKLIYMYEATFSATVYMSPKTN